MGTLATLISHYEYNYVFNFIITLLIIVRSKDIILSTLTESLSFSFTGNNVCHEFRRTK